MKLNFRNKNGYPLSAKLQYLKDRLLGKIKFEKKIRENPSKKVQQLTRQILRKDKQLGSYYGNILLFKLTPENESIEKGSSSKGTPLFTDTGLENMKPENVRITTVSVHPKDILSAPQTTLGPFIVSNYTVIGDATYYFRTKLGIPEGKSVSY